MKTGLSHQTLPFFALDTPGTVGVVHDVAMFRRALFHDVQWLNHNACRDVGAKVRPMSKEKSWSFPRDLKGPMEMWLVVLTMTMCVSILGLAETYTYHYLSLYCIYLWYLSTYV